MSRYTGNKPAAPRKAGNPMWAGILIGILVGTGMAAGLAWYLMKSPSPFLKKEMVAAPAEAPKPLPPVSQAQPSATPTTGTDNGKPRFEFYNVLTDKPAAKTTEKAAEKPKLAVAYVPQILQVGSFSSIADAENIKAKLALIGIEAHIQTATVPDKGVRYRVRLGPYKSEEEMNRARIFSKQNEVESVVMRAQ